jgi:hypothetical protein
MTADALAEVRQFCLACRGGWLSDVRYYTTGSCGMWPYRMGGIDPFSVIRARP